MSELQRTPANRRAARIVTATVVAGGLALAGGTAYANAQSTATPKPASAPAAEPAAELAAELVAEPAADTTEVSVPVDADQDLRTTYFDAGYTYDDAVVLGAQWNLDPWEAKVEGGRRLVAGETLPVEPGSSAPAEEVVDVSVSGADVEAASAALDAYFAAGYDYDDAVALGGLWNVDPFEAKVSAGEKLLAGETLPVAP